MEINANNNNSSRSKKRKISSGKEHDEEVVEDQELEDEAKMKIFFSLVRNIRESRDRWINFRSGHEDNKNKGVCRNNIIAGKEEEEEEKTVAAEVVWKPTFQLEDFAEEKALPFVASGSYNNNNNRDKEEDAEKGIDLRLSL